MPLANIVGRIGVAAALWLSTVALGVSRRRVLKEHKVEVFVSDGDNNEEEQ